MTLHRLADAYKVDRGPAGVLRWSPFEVALGLAALDQADATRRAQIERCADLQLVVDVGRV